MNTCSLSVNKGQSLTAGATAGIVWSTKDRVPDLGNRQALTGGRAKSGAFPDCRRHQLKC